MCIYIVYGFSQIDLVRLDYAVMIMTELGYDWIGLDGGIIEMNKLRPLGTPSHKNSNEQLPH